VLFEEVGLESASGERGKGGRFNGGKFKEGKSEGNNRVSECVFEFLKC
jgi:hypothetical protein